MTCVNIRQAKFELTLDLLLVNLGQPNLAQGCGISSSLRQNKNNAHKYTILKHDSKTNLTCQKLTQVNFCFSILEWARNETSTPILIKLGRYVVKVLYYTQYKNGNMGVSFIVMNICDEKNRNDLSDNPI